MSASGIAAANQRLSAAIRDGDAAAVAELYTEDGQALVSNMDILKGKAAIQAFFQGALDMGIKGLALNTLELEFHGDTAIEVGTYELLGAEGAQADRGKYVVVWKNVGDRWYLHRDIFNSSLPAPE